MSQYPVILLPDLLTEMNPLISANPIKPILPVAPRKPKALPPAPQLINFQRFMIRSAIATTISLVLGGMISLFNPSLGVGLGIFFLLTSLSFVFLQALGEKQSFSQRQRQYEQLQQSYLPQFEAYCQQLAQYEQTKETYPHALETYQAALSQWQQEIQQFREILAKKLQNAQPYQELAKILKKSFAEQRFAVVLNNYFPSHIKTGIKVPYLKDETEDPYLPDFAYVDEEINLYIDIEIDEPYAYQTREPTNYQGLETEEQRDKFFLENLWLIIRFSEEQVVRYPKSCCKVIAEVIKQITGDDTILSQLTNEPDLSPIDRWDYEEAVIMVQQDYRKTYLK